MTNYYIVFWILLSGFFFSEIYAQENFIVQRGERPAIDLQALPDDAYEKGIIKIKLNESFTNQLDNIPVFVDENGSVRFNISEIDQLNQRFEVRGFKKLFESKAFSPDFSDRHRAWGFHLWYALYFDEKTDIKELVAAYEQLPEVLIAEPEYKKELVVTNTNLLQNKTKGDSQEPPQTDWTPNDPLYNQQWHYHNTGQQSGTVDADIDLPEAWDIETGNSNVIVCIEDGGIQYNHPDLSGNMWSGLGYDFVNDDATIEPHDHGTHVAGTVAAESNNGVGVSGVAGGSGSNDGVRLMSCQVFTNSSSGGFHLAPIYAADNGACISQNSWTYTSPGSYDQVTLDAIDYFNTNGGGSALLNGGITIFAAANYNSSAQYYPAYYSGTFSVAGTNNQDMKSWYSNFGTWVDISAPGGETDVVAARGVYSTVTGSSYDFYQGTSMACPHTSGVAALVVSLAYGSLTPTDVADILLNTADNHYAVNPGYIGQLGSGRLNAYQALLETQNYISGVLNPQTFSATPVSTSQINTAWTKNTNNNNVMIVWSFSSTIGTPADGTVYTPGQTIPGGGTVLYRGSNTSFNHMSLNAATTYYYKAFSYNGSDDYSSGKSASATTFCDVISTLPFSEDFTAGVLPNCWEILDNQGNSQVWQIGSISGYNPNPALTGNYAYLNSDAFGSGNSQNSDLVSPAFNFSGYSSVNLSFNHFFRYYSPSSATVSYSIDGGNNWSQIQTWGATTANPAAFNQLIPAVDGQSNVKFKWNFTGTWGYYWAVDDIGITGTSSGTAPSCSTPVSPTNGATGVSISTDLVWNAAATATGYYLYFGTDNPPTNIVNGVNQGNTTTYSPIANLNLNTTYYWKIVPFNTYGSATGCATWNFVTAATICEIVEIDILTDDYGSETTWELVDDATGTTLLSGGPYPNSVNVHYIETICLDHGCYTFTIYDSYGDGICCAYGVGSYTVTNLTTSEVYGSGGSFGSSESVPFCVTVGTSGEWMGGITGSETDWQSSMNWGDGFIPASGIDVTIPTSPMGGYFPETNTGAGAVCNDLTIESGAHLYVPANNSLTVNGTLTNNAGTNGLVVKSDNTGMGSLIHSTSGVSASVEQYLSSERWHLVSPPVAGATINTYFDIYLKEYNEDTDTWTYLVEPTTLPMNVGQGYSAWASDAYTGSTTVTFQGTLTSNDVTLSTLDYTPAAPKAGFNLIGNPFSSALDWNTNWPMSNLSGWMLVYDNGTSKGILADGSQTYNGKTDGIIPSTQGFWVRALNGSGSLTIPVSERVHNGQAFYKETLKNIYPEIRLEMEINGYSDETVVVFHPEATAGFDGYYDLTKFDNVAEAPQLFSIMADGNYAVNFYEPDYQEKIIPVGFRTEEAGNYSIVASSIENFDENIGIYLEDLITGSYINLTNTPEYEFGYNPQDEEHRFNLHFTYLSVAVDEITVNSLRVYSADNNVFVINPNQVNGNIFIYDMMGQEIYRGELLPVKTNQISLDHGIGHYVVKVSTNKGYLTEKVLIK